MGDGLISSENGGIANSTSHILLGQPSLNSVKDSKSRGAEASKDDNSATPNSMNEASNSRSKVLLKNAKSLDGAPRGAASSEHQANSEAHGTP